MDSGVRVGTTRGDVIGRHERGALAFRGIRYAAPPIGALRFAPPAPLVLVGDVRLQHEGAYEDPARSAPAPLQNIGMMMGSRPVGACSEDCLFLDVYTPDLDRPRPVMVWVYGGGFVSGSGVDLLTHGSRLAALGDVVVVAFNYRLGALGFLHADGSSDARSNAGLHDQLAVLHWVQAEIAAFGGDPNCVTVFGESAGGMSACDLLASPRTQGLLHRVVAQSGFAESVQVATTAQQVHADFARALGVRDYDIEAMRAADSSQILSAQHQALLQARARRGGMGFRPCIDGDLVPQMPLAAIADGAGRAIPLLLGSTRDEQRLYISGRETLDADALLARVTARLGATGDAALAAAAIQRYREAHPGAAFGNIGIWCAIDTDLGYRLPALRLARARAGTGAQSWLYLWTWPSAALRGWLGACHAIDVPFVFSNLDTAGMKRFAGHGPAAEALAHTCVRTWAAFAHTGQPPQSDWRAFTSAADQVLVLDRETEVRVAPDAALVRFWQDAGF